MRLKAGWVVLAMAMLGGFACGTGAPPPDEVTLPDALTCAATSWNVIRSFGATSSVPSNLVLRDGIFYVSIADLGIIALPEAGGDPVVLTSQAAYKLWLEGDSIYFGRLDDKLRRLPLAGGTPTVDVDGKTSFVAPNYGVPDDTALDDSYFYWDLSPQSGPKTYSVWRAARAGGSAEKLADLPPRDPSYSWPLLTLTPDALVVSLDTQNVAYAVSLSGGSVRALPDPPAPGRGADNMLVGTSAEGVLWANEDWPYSAAYPTTHLSVSDVHDPTSAVARPFWPTKPPSLRPLPLKSWADGAGGWFITGTETFADGSAHTSVWQVDAAGTAGMRLGCDPNDGFGSVWSTVPTPRAVYAIVSTPGGARSTASDEWLLVRIDRSPAPAGAP